jgi:hypothetical protein
MVRYPLCRSPTHREEQLANRIIGRQGNDYEQLGKVGMLVGNSYRYLQIFLGAYCFANIKSETLYRYVRRTKDVLVLESVQNKGGEGLSVRYVLVIN